MKNLRLLTPKLATSCAVLAVGGFVCTMFAFGAQVTPLGDGVGAKRFDGTAGPYCPNTQPREPILIYNSCGSTLLGPSHCSMTVYSDGLTTLARIDPLDPNGGTFVVRTISEAVVANLAKSLSAAGAAEICDDPMSVSDMPLTTVTVSGLPGMEGGLHTFSYWEGLSAPAYLVDAVLQGFMQLELAGS